MSLFLGNSWKAQIFVRVLFLKFPVCNSILLRSGLYPAWLFWLSTRFSCCLKMKSVENIFGYIREQFYRFSRGCKPRENLWNCSRKYPKMFETYFIFRQQKSSLNQCHAWSCNYATRFFITFLSDPKNPKNPEVFLIFLWFFLIFGFVTVSSRAFLFSTPFTNSEATWKKATKCNKGNVLTTVALIMINWPLIMYCQLITSPGLRLNMFTSSKQSRPGQVNEYIFTLNVIS